MPKFLSRDKFLGKIILCCLIICLKRKMLKKYFGGAKALPKQSRITQLQLVDAGKWRQFVGLHRVLSHDMQNCHPADSQSIGNQPAMTAPRQALRAHNGAAALCCQLNELFQILFKTIRLHVIGITPERRVAPLRVERIFVRRAQTAQPGQMEIIKPGFRQCFRECFFVELRVVPRPRYRAHIDNPAYMVERNDIKEFRERMRGMADSK